MSAGTAAITVVGSLLGAAVGAGVLLLGRRQDRRERHRSELHAALVAFLAALDALVDQIRDVPVQAPPARRRAEWIGRKLPTLDFVLGRLGVRALGGARWAEVSDRFHLAGNRLSLIAPAEVLDEMQRVGELLAKHPERDHDWEEHWSTARARLLVVAREVASS